MKKVLAFAIVAVCLMVTKPAAAIVGLTVGGGWSEFSFGDVGSSFSDTWGFTIATPSVLTVTDAFLSGDQFEVFNYGSSLGLTSVPTSLNDQIDNNYDAAAFDPRWSTGFFTLGPGTYEISGEVVLSPFQSGGAALRLDRCGGEYPCGNPTVPEPASMLLLSGGLLGLAGMKRRKV